MNDLEQDLTNTVLNNFIDEEKYPIYGNLSANLVLNRSEDSNVYRVLRTQLETCKSFTFAVAFVTHQGLASFLSVLQDLNREHVHGRILTSTYLYFNRPEVFRALLKIPNIEVRIFNEKDHLTNQVLPFHAKGYLFNHQNYQTAIVGSSNLTSTALLENYEWNLIINSLSNAELTEQINLQIEDEWQKARPLTEQWYHDYCLEFEKNSQQFEISPKQDPKKITPNKMQKAALDNLVSLRQNGKNKALVISATGTGKTFLGAFDVKKFQPKRMLFVAHREQILQKSLNSFQQILGGKDEDYGVLSGHQQETNAKYLFATVQTLSKDNNLKQFSPDDFDYILFDEAHHLGAAEHQKIFDYFKPKFCLGMTATPDRMDDFNIYKLFDYNIAYEIRLQDALEAEMLSPFNYYGVEDYVYKGKVISDASTLKNLVSDERVDYIIQQTDYYGYSGKYLHGLIFCSRTDEAQVLAQKLTEKGFAAQALSGKDSIDKRKAVVQKLQENQLKYIVTVDVFNEGIDIPSINQVVLLRSTQSSIVFIQQLGRGLRKAKGKDYLTVIDFIGNYNNNYLIPVALTGDKSHDKRHLRDQMDLQTIHGLSVINFTKVAKSRIYHSLENSNLTLKRKLREEYLQEKRKLGRIPLMFELEQNSISCSVIADKYKNYYRFLQEMGETAYHLSDFENKVLAFATVVLANGKRQQELILLKQFLNGNLLKQDYVKILKEHHCIHDEATIASVENLLSLDFFDQGVLPNKQSYGGHALIKNQNGVYSLSTELLEALENKDFDTLFKDAITTGIYRQRYYDSRNIFTIGQEYSRDDACRLLNWQKRLPGNNIGGYKFDQEQMNCAIFVTYDKSKDHDTIAYPDRFISPNLLNMFSKAPRKIASPEIRNFQNNAYSFYLFVKKSDEDGKHFVYLGKCRPQKGTFEQRYIEKYDKKSKEMKRVPVVAMDLKLETPVELNRYYDLTKNI